MRVDLFTIEVSDELRVALAWKLGKKGLASRRDVREYLQVRVVRELERVKLEHREESQGLELFPKDE